MLKIQIGLRGNFYLMGLQGVRKPRAKGTLDLSAVERGVIDALRKMTISVTVGRKAYSVKPSITQIAKALNRGRLCVRRWLQRKTHKVPAPGDTAFFSVGGIMV